MRLAQLLGILEKLFLVLLTLGIVAYLWVVFNNWADPFRTYFVRMGDLEMFIYLSVFLLIVSYIFKKLLVWEVHLMFRPHSRRRAR